MPIIPLEKFVVVKEVKWEYWKTGKMPILDVFLLLQPSFGSIDYEDKHLRFY